MFPDFFVAPRLSYNPEARLGIRPWSDIHSAFAKDGYRPKLAEDVAAVFWRAHRQLLGGEIELMGGHHLRPFVISRNGRPYRNARQPGAQSEIARLSMTNLYNFLDGDGLFTQRVRREITPEVSDAINRFVNSSVL